MFFSNGRSTMAGSFRHKIVRGQTSFREILANRNTNQGDDGEVVPNLSSRESKPFSADSPLSPDTLQETDPRSYRLKYINRRKAFVFRSMLSPIDHMTTVENLKVQLSVAHTRVRVLEDEVISLKKRLLELSPCEFDEDDVLKEDVPSRRPLLAKAISRGYQSDVEEFDSDLNKDHLNASDHSNKERDNTMNEIVPKGGNGIQYNKREKGCGKLRQAVGDFIDAPKTQNVIVALIIMNSITMGIGTFDFVTEDPKTENTFEILDFFCLCMFTIELLLHSTHKLWKFFDDGWLIFDLVVVLISWVGALSNNADLSVKRAFRILRVMQIIPKVKIMRGLVSAMLSTFPNMSATIFLLSIMLYIFGVLFTSLFSFISEDEEYDDLITLDYFSRLDKSIFTLIQIMTLDSWNKITRELIKVSPHSWILLFTFILVADAIFLNLMVAIICGTIPLISESNDDDAKKHHHPLVRLQDAKLERCERRLNEINEMIYRHMLNQQKTARYIEDIARQLESVKKKNFVTL